MSARTVATTGQAPAAHTTAVLAIICVSYFMVILDNSIIFTGLPDIHAAMCFSESGLSWVTNAYALVFGGLLLLGARAHPGRGRLQRDGARFSTSPSALRPSGT